LGPHFAILSPKHFYKKLQLQKQITLTLNPSATAAELCGFKILSSSEAIFSSCVAILADILA